jgi:radical SAM protein with 4Fe4S-binding SPASM domain
VNFQKTFLVDQDPYKNQPVSSTSFSRTQDEEKCKTCPFRKVCEELKAFE